MSDTLYKFRSKSQCILVIDFKGRRKKVRFDNVLNGISRYSTSEPEIAEEIRQSWQFRTGRILEDAPVSKTAAPPPEPEKAESRPEEKPEEEKKAPAWMKMVNKNDQPAHKAVGGQQLAGGSTPSRDPDARQQETDKEQERRGAAGVQSTMFDMEDGEKMSLTEVFNYMDAKTYLRDVLKVDARDVRTKDQLQNYCKEHGIQFPNYTI